MKKLLSFALCLVTAVVFAAPSAPLRRWPGIAPGETREFPAEGDTTKPTDRLVTGVPIVRLGNVTQPTITVYRPDPAKDTGAASNAHDRRKRRVFIGKMETTPIF